MGDEATIWPSGGGFSIMLISSNPKKCTSDNPQKLPTPTWSYEGTTVSEGTKNFDSYHFENSKLNNNLTSKQKI